MIMNEGYNSLFSDNSDLPDLDNDNDTVIQNCDSPDCQKVGQYRAPKSREHLRDYYWFCLEHVRIYNKSWNYYSGMSEDEVEVERRADTYWHRPTRPLGGESFYGYKINGGFRLFDDEDSGKKNHSNNMTATTIELEALSVLDLSPPVTRQEIKNKYKELVKTHHPDTNRGNKDAEEQLKLINRAYETLTRAKNIEV